MLLGSAGIFWALSKCGLHTPETDLVFLSSHQRWKPFLWMEGLPANPSLVSSLDVSFGKPPGVT